MISQNFSFHVDIDENDIKKLIGKPKSVLEIHFKHALSGQIYIKIDNIAIEDHFTQDNCIKTSPFFVEPLTFFFSWMVSFIESVKLNKQDFFDGEDFAIEIQPINFPLFKIKFEHQYHNYEVQAIIDYYQFKDQILKEYKKIIEFMNTIVDENIQNLSEIKNFYKIYNEIKNYE